MSRHFLRVTACLFRLGNSDRLTRLRHRAASQNTHYGGGHVQDSHLFDEMRFLHRYAEVGHLCRGVAPEGQSPEAGGGLPGNRDNKNCGNSRRNCRSRISASKTTAVRTCRPRCGSHRLSSSPDLRFPGFAWPSQGNPNDRLSPHAEPPRIQWRYRS